MYMATYIFTYDIRKHVIRERTELVKTESPIYIGKYVTHLLDARRIDLLVYS